MLKMVQAKAISDEQIVLAVQSLVIEKRLTTREYITALFPNVPPKVTSAKLRQAALKGKLIGCTSDKCARKLRCHPACGRLGEYKVADNA